MTPPVKPEPDLSPEDFKAWQDFQKWKGSQSLPSSSADALHAEFKRGDLATRIANENAVTNAEDNPDLPTQALGTLASLGRHIPGVEAAQAGASALVNRIPYRDARQQLQQAEDASGMAGDIAGAVGGGLALAATPGAGLAEQGARLGFTGALAQSDPDKGVRQRIGEGIKEAALQGTLGKLGEYIGTANRGLTTPTPAAQRVALKAARGEASGPGYTAFRAAPDLEPPTGPEGPLPPGPLRQSGILDLPVVRSAITTVKGESPTLNGLPDTDPRVLDAVYKRVGKKAFAAAHGYETDEARQSLLDAIEQSAQQAGAPSYAEPVGAFREGSKLMDANRLGARVLKNTVRGTPEGQAETASPEAFQSWRRNPKTSAAEIAEANKGIAGQLGTRQSPVLARLNVGIGRWPIPVPSASLREAVPLLSQTGTPPTALNLIKNWRGTP